MDKKTYVYTNVTVANLYASADFNSPIISQTILWERLLLLKEKKSFYYVQGEDEYKGWIHRRQVSHNCQTLSSTKSSMVAKNLTYFHTEPNVDSPTIGMVLAGTILPVLQDTNNWSLCIYPDNTQGWIMASSFSKPKKFTRENLISYGKTFIRSPYLWGGKTPLGFDCSGFIQFIHKMHGINIRRDAYMQFKDARYVSDNINDAEVGDLCFFAENSHDRITHIGLIIAKDTVLHARGFLRINSFDKNNDYYDKELLTTIKGIGTFF